MPPVLSPRLRGDCRLKDNASRALRNDDPFDLYDWLLNAYAKMTQEHVAAGLFQDHPHITVFPGDGIDVMPVVTGSPED